MTRSAENDAPWNDAPWNDAPRNDASQNEASQSDGHDDVLPWLHVEQEHQHSYRLSMVRLEARRRAGEDLREVDLGRLGSWLHELREINAVVLYVPDTPDGFYLVPRLAQDGQGIVRRPGVGQPDTRWPGPRRRSDPRRPRPGWPGGPSAAG